VCFDVDSTVCTDEGIDELAAFCGAGEAVAALTASAMGGSVPFQDALAARLDLIKPSAPVVASFLADHPPRLCPGIAELVAALHGAGKAVFLVSGGFTQMIHPVADLLAIPRDRVFANTLLFDAASGAAAGFDTTAFTSRAGGKAAAIKHIKAASGGALAPMVMIGDGATDLEARMPGGADLFIGYGGVAQRKVVMDGADWFVTSFTPLIDGLR
jgi:phosphoserine phosphatase